jgi:hypothetical protein
MTVLTYVSVTREPLVLYLLLWLFQPEIKEENNFIHFICKIITLRRYSMYLEVLTHKNEV